MKKIMMGLFFCMLCIGLLACKKKEKEKELTPVQEAWTQIRPEEDTIIDAYAMDEAGNVYLVFQRLEEPGTWLSKFYPSGEEEIRLKLTDFFRERNFQCTCLFVEDETVYLGCSIYEGVERKTVLSAFDMAENRLDVLTDVLDTKELLRILGGEDCLYLLLREKTFWGGGAAGTVYRFDKKAKEPAVALMENVMDISMNPEGKLILYAGVEAGKLGLLEYSEEKNAVKRLKTFDKQEFNYFAITSGERLVYCMDEMRALVVSSLSSLSDIVTVYPWGVGQDSQISVVNGRSISRAENNSVVVVDLEKIGRENKSIRFLTTEARLGNKPFSCGFSMQYTEVPPEKLALKILAMDQDFDICLVRGDNSMNRAMRENASFYPLDGVAGIEEYFDECYPYVREAATAEDGSLWMLPIRMDVPVLVADTSADIGVLWPEDADMTLEEYFGVLGSFSEEQAKKAEKADVQRNFICSYVVRNQSVDTELFREKVCLFQEKQDVWKRCDGELGYQSDYKKDNYVLRYVNGNTESVIRNSMGGYGPDARVYAYPKVEKTEKNAGTCDYFVINPNSDHLEDVLSFLESYILYVRNSKEKPFFFRTLDTQGNSVLEQVRSIYENAEILFLVDSELYDGYNEVIGKTKDLEGYIRETNSKLKIYFEE